MTIRITNQLYTNNLMDGPNNAMKKIMELRDQITSGRKISTPSQDPISSVQIMNLNTQLAKLSDWRDNIGAAKDEVKTVYDVLGVAYDQLKEIDALAIEGSNGGTSLDQMIAIRDEVAARTKTILDIANTKYGDNYLFAGTNVATKPFALEADGTFTYSGTSSGDTWQRKLEITEGEEVTLNLLGENIFGDGTTGIFATLTELNNALSLDPPDLDAVRGTLDNLQKGLKQITRSMAEASSIVTRLDITKDLNETIDLTLTENRANMRDTNVVDASTELAMQQTMLQASYQVSSMLLSRPSLLDYI